MNDIFSTLTKFYKTHDASMWGEEQYHFKNDAYEDFRNRDLIIQLVYPISRIGCFLESLKMIWNPEPILSHHIGLEKILKIAARMQGCNT